MRINKPIASPRFLNWFGEERKYQFKAQMNVPTTWRMNKRMTLRKLLVEVANPFCAYGGVKAGGSVMQALQGISLSRPLLIIAIKRVICQFTQTFFRLKIIPREAFMGHCFILLKEGQVNLTFYNY